MKGKTQPDTIKGSWRVHQYEQERFSAVNMTLVPLWPYMATLHIWKTVFRASPLADLNENQLMRRGMRPKHDIIISNQSL